MEQKMSKHGIMPDLQHQAHHLHEYSWVTHTTQYWPKQVDLTAHPLYDAGMPQSGSCIVQPRLDCQ